MATDEVGREIVASVRSPQFYTLVKDHEAIRVVEYEPHGYPEKNFRVTMLGEPGDHYSPLEATHNIPPGVRAFVTDVSESGLRQFVESVCEYMGWEVRVVREYRVEQSTRVIEADNG